MMSTPVSGKKQGNKQMVRLWIGVFVALFAGFAMFSASRFGVLVGSGGTAILAALATVGLAGAVVVGLSLRHPSDLASTPQTGLLLDRLQADPELLRVAEKSGSAEELRRTVVAALDAAEARRLFGARDDRQWSEAVRWDELYDALPRKGRQVPR